MTPMDSRNLSACPNCGHDWHPSGAVGSCAVFWMDERCNCRRMARPKPKPTEETEAEIRKSLRMGTGPLALPGYRITPGPDGPIVARHDIPADQLALWREIGREGDTR